MIIINGGGGSRWRQLYPVMFNDGGGGELSSGKTNRKKMKKWKKPTRDKHTYNVKVMNIFKS